jgi:hypothetical protein
VSKALALRVGKLELPVLNSQAGAWELAHIDQSEDKDLYSVVLVKEGDGEFYIKSDYFDDTAEPYPLDVEISDDDVKFILKGEDEDMYLYGFFE